MRPDERILVAKRCIANSKSGSGRAFGILTAEIVGMVKSYYSCFYRYELRSMSELHRRRDLFKRRIARLSRLSAEELFLAGGLAQVADIMLDLSELRMAVGY